MASSEFERSVKGPSIIEIPTQDAGDYDVIVVGAGFSGICAALASARNGAKTLLGESFAFPGGNGITGLPISSFRARQSPEMIVRGIPLEIVRRLERRSAVGGRVEEMAWLPINPEILQLEIVHMIEESGVDLLCHSPLLAARKAEQEIRECVFYNKDTAALAYRAKVFVDTSGDAQLASLSGCGTKMGRQRDGKTQAMSLLFQVGGVDEAVAANPEEVSVLWNRMRTEGAQWSSPATSVGFSRIPGRPGFFCFNVTRILVSKGTDHRVLTQAELEGRKQLEEFFFRFLRPHAPGFGNSFLAGISPRVGVRETRRILSIYELQCDDLLSAKKFDDSIACNASSVEIHDPEGGGTQWKSPPMGGYYTIPYRSLVARDADNLLGAGRCVGASHEALAAVRVLSAAMATGEAAGTAAALCATQGCKTADLDPKKLRETLRANGARVD